MNETCNFCGAEYHRIEDHCCHCTSLLQQLAAMTKKNKRLPGVCHDYRTTHGTMVGQLAAMTKERNSYYQTYRMNCDIKTKALHEQLAASQAREAKLREDINAIQQLSCYPEDVLRICRDALALPFDDSPLQELLKQERERCATIAEETAAGRDAEAIADAIRALT